MTDRADFEAHLGRGAPLLPGCSRSQSPWDLGSLRGPRRFSKIQFRQKEKTNYETVVSLCSCMNLSTASVRERT